MKKLLAGLVVFFALISGSFAMDFVLCGGLDAPTYNYKEEDEIHNSIGVYGGCYVMLVNGVGVGASLDIAFPNACYDQNSKETSKLDFSYLSLDALVGLTYSPFYNENNALIFTAGFIGTLYTKVKTNRELNLLGVGVDVTYNYFLWEGLGLDFGLTAAYYFLGTEVTSSKEVNKIVKGLYKVTPRIGISLLVNE